MTEESELKAELKALFKARGAYVVPVAQGAYSKKGDPDMVVCYKGLFVAVEAKTYTGRQSDWQRTRMDQVHAAGGIYAIVRSTDAARQLLAEIDRRYGDGAQASEMHIRERCGREVQALGVGHGGGRRRCRV